MIRRTWLVVLVAFQFSTLLMAENAGMAAIEANFQRGDAMMRGFGIDPAAMRAQSAAMHQQFMQQAAMAHAQFNQARMSRRPYASQPGPIDIKDVTPTIYIPETLVQSESHWTYHYNRIANELAPGVIYDVKLATGSTIEVPATQPAVDALKKNMAFIKYYRDQVDKVCTSEAHRGAQRFAKFLDFCVAAMDGLVEGGETREVTLEGKRKNPQFELNERTRQLHMIALYRYLENKYVVYPSERERFGQADISLWLAFRNLMAIYGIRFHDAWLNPENPNKKLNIESQEKTEDAWKRPIADANDALNDKNQQPCIISMPKPPEQKPAEPKKEDKPQEIIIKLQK